MKPHRLIARLVGEVNCLLVLFILATIPAHAGKAPSTIELKDGSRLMGEILAVGDSSLAYTFNSGMDYGELVANPGFISIVRLSKISRVTTGGTSHGWAGLGLGLAAGAAIGAVIGSNETPEPKNAGEAFAYAMVGEPVVVPAVYGVIGGVAGGLLGGIIGAAVVTGETELHPDDPVQRDALRLFARYPDREPELLVVGY